LALSSFLKIVGVAFCLTVFTNSLQAQFKLSGTVYDSSKINYVPDVIVANKSGIFTTTDSMGRYSIWVNEKDSITFTFRNKSTQKFAVTTVTDPLHFDISLRVKYKGKYSTLKEVMVFSKSYREDSIENRRTYSSIYSYTKPTVKSSTTPSGMVGADVNELINIFRFKRNKRLKAFQLRLEADEQEKYINYRFSKTLIKKLTHLPQEQLDIFMMRYRPTYEFCSMADELVLNQYILNCSYKYKIEVLQKDATK
jgi:plasmid maintenance system killer protein